MMLIRKLRSILIWIDIAIVTLFFLSLSVIAVFITLPFDFKRKVPHFIGNLWAKTIMMLIPITKLSFFGNLPVDKKKTYVIVFNHMSFADIVTIGCLGLGCKWISKESIFKVPFFGFVMKLCGYISVMRGDRESHAKCMHKARYWLSEDISIVISPEGTRSKDGTIGEFKSGFAKLAIEFGLPILPISIVGARDILPKGSWIFPKNNGVRVYVGTPIESKEYTLQTKDILKEKVRNVMIENFNKLYRAK